MFRFVTTLLQRAVATYLRADCGPLAAAISYFAVFSLFPLMIFIIAIAGLLIQDEGLQDDIIDEILNNFPLDEGEGRDAVTDAVHGIGQTGSGAMGLVALAGMAWGGSSLFGSLRRALNVVFEDAKAKRAFVPQKLIDLGLVLALFVFFMTSIAATAVLRIARHHSSEFGALGEAAENAGRLWDLASYAIPLVFSLIAFTALYCVVPSRLRTPTQVWPGALLAALAFEAVKLGFGFYLENFSNYDVVFGSLATAVALLFWLFLSAHIMLFGAAVATEYPRVPAKGYKQSVMEGLKPPLKQRAWKAFRGLFVQARKPDARADTVEDGEPAQPRGVAPTERGAPRG